MNPTTLLSGLGAAVTADPAFGGASTPGRGSSSGSGDLFLALVAGLLQGSAQEDLGTVPGATAEPDAEAAPTGLPAVVTGGLAPVPVPVPVPAPVPAPVPVPVPVNTDETQAETDTDATSAETDTDVSMLPMAPIMAPIVVQPAVTAGTDGPGDAATTGSSVDATTGAVAAPSAGGSAQAGTDTDADQPTDGRPAVANPDGSSSPRPADSADQPAVASPAGPRVDVRADAVPTQPTGVPTAVGVAPATALTAVAAPATSADLPRVTDQVFPEVLRATSNAENGTTRVIVKLNPESLGEVRVVLTQRGGELEVTLAGGADARRALTDGAPELRRLLESVGRADSRIFIRDLPTVTPATVPAASGQATRTDVSTDLAGGAWSGAGSPGGEPAPDRDTSRNHPGSTTAKDGTPSATIPSRPIQTAGRTHAGLDLSM